MGTPVVLPPCARFWMGSPYGESPSPYGPPLCPYGAPANMRRKWRNPAIVLPSPIALTMSAGKSFSKMKTKFGRVASSRASRGLYMTTKTLAFIYLSLVYISGWPAWIGYALTAIVVTYSLVRGAAEIYEALPGPKH